MRIRATSDLHLTQATAPYVFAALEQLRKDAHKHGGATVICGDVFDQAVSVNMPLWNMLLGVLRSFRGAVVLIPGNHDQYDDYRNALEGFHGGKIKVVTTADPRVVAYGGDRIGACIPYTSNFDDVFQWVLENRDRNAPKLVFCHHGFKGAYLNEMYKCRRGASVRSIPGDTLVVSGHYHMPQVLGRVIYCGSPYELTFSEEGQDKGWLLWKDASKSLIPKRIAFKDLGAPRHITIHWDPDEGSPSKPKGLRDSDRVRVIVPSSKSDHPDAASDLNKAGILAPVVFRPVSGATVQAIDDFKGDVIGAVRAFVQNNSAHSPDDMWDFSEREGLWEDWS